MRRLTSLRAAGFSLIEVLVATGVLTVGVLGLAQLLIVATAANADARKITMATILARGKLEDLRAVAWGSVVVSPPGALQNDSAGFVDYLDDSGLRLGSVSGAPAGAGFARRWSVEPLPSDPANAVVVQVLVEPRSSRARPARLLSVKTRWD